jgi:hypothetical protein
VYPLQTVLCIQGDTTVGVIRGSERNCLFASPCIGSRAGTVAAYLRL